MQTGSSQPAAGAFATTGAPAAKLRTKEQSKTIKYEILELTTLTPAITAIQAEPAKGLSPIEGIVSNESSSAYEDWE